MSAGFTTFFQGLGHPIPYYPALGRMLGSVKSAIFLAQLMYWTPRGKKDSGWVFKTAEEWEAETGLTYEEQFGARKILSDRNVIETRYARREHTTYYRVRREVLDALWEEAPRKSLDAQEHQGKASVASRKNLGGTKEKPSSRIPETTPKTTPEITTTNPAPRNGAAKPAQAVQGLLIETAVAVDAEVLEASPVLPPRPAGSPAVATAAPGATYHAATGAPAPLSTAAARAPVPRDLMVAFDQAYTAFFGAAHPKMGGQEAALAKGLLEQYGLPKCLEFVSAFFALKDPWLEKTGKGFSIFASKNTITKLIALGANGNGARPARIHDKWRGAKPGLVSL